MGGTDSKFCNNDNDPPLVALGDWQLKGPLYSTIQILKKHQEQNDKERDRKM